MELKDSLDGLREACANALKFARPVRAPSLGVYEWEGRKYSSLLEFFGVLINGEWQRVALPCAPIAEMLTTTRPLFGFETIEYRTPTRTRFGAMLGIIEYSTPTVVGLFDALLSTPFPWVLTQSFAFLKKASAQALLQRQYNRMQSAADFAVSQAEELRDALDELTSSEWVMGEHHLSLQVLTEFIEHVDSASRDRELKLLNDNLARARTLLADHAGHDHWARGPRARGRLLGATPGKLRVSPAQGSHYVAQFRRHGELSQFSVLAERRATTGARR